MHMKLHLFFFVVIVFAIELTFGRSSNKTKFVASNHKRHNSAKGKLNINRIKRALEENETPFWPHKERSLYSDNLFKFKNDVNSNEKAPDSDSMDTKPAFWGTRGRRDSSAEEDTKSLKTILVKYYYAPNGKLCNKPTVNYNNEDDGSIIEEVPDGQNPPFWGSRGRRNSGKSIKDSAPFRGYNLRQEEEIPFWASRGRRQDDMPFWGSRGRRYNWISQDLTEDPPFWENRGSHDDSEHLWRRREELQQLHNSEEEMPFWASRGKRQGTEPFSSNRGKRESKTRRREDLKQFLKDAINKVEDNIEGLIKSQLDDDIVSKSFWNSRGRESQLANMFKSERNRHQIQSLLNKYSNFNKKPSESSTVLDDRIFAEQPHFILAERSSRSSGEEDPFFISRGKKKVINYHISEAVRDRRGALEELVKSVRNDPYYIARGKKDTQSNSNLTVSQKDIGKAKELICATLDLLLFKKENNKTKREINDNERDRRTILKKLAAQLQVDPYFVSRGKRNDSGDNENNLDMFIKEMSLKCN